MPRVEYGSKQYLEKQLGNLKTRYNWLIREQDSVQREINKMNTKLKEMK